MAELYIEDEYITNPLPAIRAGKTSRPNVYGYGGDNAVGTVTFGVIPVATEVFILDGIYVEFTAAASDGTAAGTVGDPLLVNIKASLELTLDETTIVLNATANATIAVATYSNDATILTITHDTDGSAGNAYTMVSADGNHTLSGATLAGGADVGTVALTHQDVHFTITEGQEQDQAFTLADGDEGQSLHLYFVLKQDGNVVITPANLTGGTTVTFDALDEWSDLYFAGGSWIQKAGTATVA